MQAFGAVRFQSFWLSNNIEFNEQHIFRPCPSTATNLVKCDAIISNILNSGYSCDVIIIDFKRAFDQVPYANLVYKLCRMGLGSSVVNWVSNFF